MKYAIRTLEIELAKIEETQRIEDRYSVYPEYMPACMEWQERRKARLVELQKAIGILHQYRENEQCQLFTNEKR